MEGDLMDLYFEAGDVERMLCKDYGNLSGPLSETLCDFEIDDDGEGVKHMLCNHGQSLYEYVFRNACYGLHENIFKSIFTYIDDYHYMPELVAGITYKWPRYIDKNTFNTLTLFIANALIRGGDNSLWMLRTTWPHDMIDYPLIMLATSTFFAGQMVLPGTDTQLANQQMIAKKIAGIRALAHRSPIINARAAYQDRLEAEEAEFEAALAAQDH